MKLAVVGQIIEIHQIDGAEKIQQARVNCEDAGTWTGVCGKNIKVGEKVTVFLQDAQLPRDERWAFMESRKWRVRICRFMGMPSECLILDGCPDLEVGTDLTDVLGVTKFVKFVPAGLAGEMAGAFPSFIPKTDEPNYQTVDWKGLLASDNWYASEKADGSSCTVWRDDDGSMHVASRNWELREYTTSGAKNSFWETAKLYDWTHLPTGMSAQFEVVGGKIQGNPMGLENGTQGRLFTLYDYVNHKRIGRAELEAVAKIIGIPVAPKILLSKEIETEDDLRELANIKYANGKSGEGVVIRDVNNTWSFKVISLEYKG